MPTQPIHSYTPVTFDKENVDGWKQHLEEEGYAVIHNIFDSTRIQEAIELFWKDWNTVSPGFARNDPSTWSIQTAPLMFTKGAAVFNGFGQSDFMWYLRVQPEILEIFSHVHNIPSSELITSFDGFSVFFSKKQKNPRPWWHIDQHPSNPLYSIQGAYNFLPVDDINAQNVQSAGFTVIPKSHLTFVPSQTRNSADWIEIDKNKTAEETSQITSHGVKLLVPANTFILWNSKTIHANTGITSINPRIKTDSGTINRLTTYITCVPRNRCTSEEITQKRIQAYLDGSTTSHWPEKVEIKTYPWGFGPRYESRGYGRIQPTLTESGTIPADRLQYI